MNMKVRVWLKIVMHNLILELHFMDVTQDRACLVFSLIFDMDINFGTILKSSLQKARVNHGCKYAFDSLSLLFDKQASMMEKPLDYRTNIQFIPFNVTNTKGPEQSCRADSNDTGLGSQR